MSEFEENQNIESGSPAQLAQQLFSKAPCDSGSMCILPYSESHDNDAVSFNFEILLTIYLEGFMNILDVSKNNYILQNAISEDVNGYEIENLIYKNITLEDLKFPDPWFKSFGYLINITEYEKKEFNTNEFNTKVKSLSYCRVLLSFDPKDRIHFLMKGIASRYTFILSGGYKATNDITNIYAILSKDDKFYKISFEPLNK